MRSDPPVPSFKLLCVMTHHVLDRIGTDADVSDIVAELKTALAHARLAYPPPDHFAAVADAVRLARAKGYLTPRRKTVPCRH